MSKRTSLVLLAVLTSGMLGNGLRQAVPQRERELTQTLVIGYPTQGILLGERGPRYTGLIYVKVYPVNADRMPPYRARPIASAELTASQRDVRSLPVGEYEVHFAMRRGSQLNTFILRDVILRADRASLLTVEMNGSAPLTIIGGDMTAQQMATTIRQLQQEVARLKQP